ncbi:hypothetical protein HMPREF1145_2074 [Oribacterium parvum ACB8]|nr:hypothetical protein HMPREF1145_2074 [Oribacterium parvum ACB8]
MVKGNTLFFFACQVWCITVFYTGIGASLFLAGVLFDYQL